jgi:hypothetical protein
MSYVTVTAPQGFDFDPVDIEANDSEASLSERKGDRKTGVSQPKYTDHSTAIFELFQCVIEPVHRLRTPSRIS